MVHKKERLLSYIHATLGNTLRSKRVTIRDGEYVILRLCTVKEDMLDSLKNVSVLDIRDAFIKLRN